MGIAFITAKAERFQHQRDEAFKKELGSPNLFSGLPEAIIHTYRFKAIAEEIPAPGTGVLIFRSEGLVRAFHLNVAIGVALPPDAAELGEIMDQQGTAALAARIAELRPASGTFVVAVETGTGSAQ
jgi:hypothetical protein